MMVHESKVSVETLRFCMELVGEKRRSCAVRYRRRQCKQYADDLQAVEARLEELAAEIAAQELGEEEYPPSREASAITALQALREAVRRAEEGIMAYLGAGGSMGEAIVGILREETRPHMGEGDS